MDVKDKKTHQNPREWSKLHANVTKIVILKKLKGRKSK